MSLFPPAGDNEGLLPPKSGGGGSGAWGGISGTLSDQTDLQAALDAKVDLSGDTMTGTLVTAAPSIAAGLRLQAAGADPSSPVDGDVWRRTSDMRARIGGTSYTFAFLNGTSTFTGKKTFAASTSGGTTLNVAPGTAPSSPVDGDVWTTTTGVFAQVNGATVQLDTALSGGVTTIDFGPAPGTGVASKTLTGIGGVAAGSRVRAWLSGATADHNAYEHQTILPGRVSLAAHDIVAGTGFTITASTELRLTGEVACAWEFA